jgi:hypothetical protein
VIQLEEKVGYFTNINNQAHPEAQIKNFDFIATIEVAILPT